MQTAIHSFWAAIETVFALTILGLAASFSPTLYVAQAGASAKSRKVLRKAYAPLIGVVIALVLLLVIFQFLHLNTLVAVIGSTASALLVSTAVNVLVGAACIYGGVRLMEGTDNLPRPVGGKTSGDTALIWLGFVRTFFSVSGLTATFLGANLIAETKTGLFVQSCLTVFFLIVACTPFLAAAYLALRLPGSVSALFAAAGQMAKRLRYRYYVGVAAVLFGLIIIAAQIVRALLS